MSTEPGENSTNPYTHFKAGMKDFFRLDKVRFVNIVGSIQYGLIYAIVFFFAGIGIERIFPGYNPHHTIKSLTIEIVLQCLVIIIVIFYIRKFVEAIPGIISFFPKMFNLNLAEMKSKGFIPYGVDEYKGEIMLSLILIGTEVNLLKKIGRLSELGSKHFIG